MIKIIKNISNTDSHEHPILGITIGLLAYFFLNLMNIISKYISDDYHFIELAFWRFTFAFLPLFIWIAFTNRKAIAAPNSKKWISARAIGGTCGLVCTFATLSYLPITVATAIFFTHVFLVPVMSIFFLKDFPGIWRVSAIIIGFIGTFIITDPTNEAIDLPMIGLAFGVLTAIIYASLAIIVKQAGKYDSPQTITLYFMGTGMGLTGLYWAINGDGFHFGEDALYLIGIGLSGLLGQLCLTTAFKFAQPTAITLTSYTGLIWAILFGWLLWAEIPTIAMIVGMILISAANLLVFWREKKHKQEQIKDES